MPTKTWVFINQAEWWLASIKRGISKVSNVQVAFWPRSVTRTWQCFNGCGELRLFLFFCRWSRLILDERLERNLSDGASIELWRRCLSDVDGGGVVVVLSSSFSLLFPLLIASSVKGFSVNSVSTTATATSGVVSSWCLLPGSTAPMIAIGINSVWSPSASPAPPASLLIMFSVLAPDFLLIVLSYYLKKKKKSTQKWESLKK